MVLGDRVVVVLTSARKTRLRLFRCQLGSVVGAGKGESEGGLIRGTVGVSDGVVDGEFKNFTVGEGLIRRMRWIKLPRSISLNRQAVDRSAD